MKVREFLMAFLLNGGSLDDEVWLADWDDMIDHPVRRLDWNVSKGRVTFIPHRGHIDDIKIPEC